MSVSQGYKTEVFVTTSSSTASSSDILKGANTASFKRMFDELETTAFSDAGEQTMVGGVKKTEADGSGAYDSADTPTGRLETAAGDRSSVWIHYYPLGRTVAGKKVECKCSNFEWNSEVKGLASFSFNCKSTGAVATASTF